MDPIPETPGGAPLEPHQPSPRRVKRRLMAAVIVLHAASLLAAAFLIVRSRGDGPKTESGGSAKNILNLKPKDSVGWVSIRGPIMSSESGKPWERGAEQWARRIEQMAETKGVKAIVLDINSPGGSVGAVQEIYTRILRVKEKHKDLKFVALFGDVAASGGYYLGAACDKIVAHPGTLTGSIGVIFNVSNMEGLFAKVGYKSDPIKSGRHKDIGSPARPMTAEERLILQSLIDDAYGQFVAAVAKGRNLPEDVVRPLADGRIYSGNQALSLKLVDQLGDSVDATKLAAELGGIKDENPRVRRDTEKLNDIFELLETRARLTLGMSSAGLTLGAAAPTPRGLLYAWAGGL
ncbi:MAG: signal peptide peptidase SppA [Elusimicrobia bacterium]|nr:signal peptide peptidase SppA [Elusimicrobiota bacterium]